VDAQVRGDDHRVTSALPGRNGRAGYHEPVAIIGLGCVLPDAPDVPTFWANLRSGRCSIREVPRDRWDPRLYYTPDRSDADRSYSKIGSFVTDFVPDTRRHRMPPNVLKAMDAGQLWALAAAEQALADAGYDARPFDRSRCAVILGATGSEEMRTPTALRVYFPYIRAALESTAQVRSLPEEERGRFLAEAEAAYKAGLPRVTEDTMPGELANVIAGRVANLLNLRGPNFVTDAACASSAAAIDAACKALRAHEADVVLTGGADRNQGISMFVKFCRIGALSATGSFPFDERADGFVMGEGAVVLLLKRLRDAERDGDRVYAVVRGVGASSDGKGKGITAPNVEGQVEALRRALDDAGLHADDVDAIEGHGTGTVVGDAAEAEALRRVYLPRSAAPLPIGSVKSNLGHLKSAAGALSVLKAALALHHGELPPTLGVGRPSPHLRLDGSPLRVATEATRWPETDRPRRIGVSCFGFGGSNFHLVLEQAQRTEARLWPLLVA
jgi:acyl transferase domain-containing protein